MVNIESSAQVQKGKVSYNVNMNRFIEEIKSESTDKNEVNHYYKISEVLKDIQFDLLFENNLAVFKNEKILSLDKNQIFNKMALLYCSKGTYLTNTKEKAQILITNFDGSEMKVKIPFEEQNDWKLTKESKEIEGFVCYKAIKTVTVPKGKRNIIAWYTPEIPISLGPKEYVGQLPGLIMEIHDLLVSFTCSHIDLDSEKNNVAIQWPKDINTMTEEEYIKEGDKVKTKLATGW